MAYHLIEDMVVILISYVDFSDQFFQGENNFFLLHSHASVF